MVFNALIQIRIYLYTNTMFKFLVSSFVSHFIEKHIQYCISSQFMNEFFNKLWVHIPKDCGRIQRPHSPSCTCVLCGGASLLNNGQDK